MNIVQEESTRDLKKNKRRLLMLDNARRLIAVNGLRSLKVRDVANAAACSIGSIYNEFGDFDGLILTVNRETFEALDSLLSMVPDKEPVKQLHALASAYLDFATEHPNLLRALFEHRMENDRPFPDDLLQMVLCSFQRMHDPLVALLPNRDPDEVATLARTLFSAVHGIISLGLEDKLVAVPRKGLRQEIRKFVDTHLAGLGIQRIG